MESQRKKRNGGLDIGLVTRWGSLIGGGALLFFGVKSGLPKRPSFFSSRQTWIPGWLMALAGADAVYYGIRGEGHLHNLAGIGHTKAGGGAHTSVAYRSSIRVDEAFTVNKPAEELYRFWRRFENLPKIMRHLRSVKAINGKKSHWVARAPAGMKAEWDAEIINDIPNELIAWRSLNNPGVDSAGSVHFKQLPGNRGTRVSVTLRYDAPGGEVGALIARLLGEDPKRQVREDLRRFKASIESGEAATEGQPAKRAKLRAESHAPLKRQRLNRKVA